MHQDCWGISVSPFCGCLAPQFFYQSPTHEEAIARLHFLVDQRRRLGLLIGPSGSGKSLLLEVFAGQLQRAGKPTARMSLLAVEPDEFLWQLAAAWGVDPSPTASIGQLWRRVTDRLTEYRYRQLTTVVLLDDADQAGDCVLPHVARLARYHMLPEMRLTLILAGQPEGVGRLGRHLLDLVDLRIDVEPWDQNDTQQYLTSALERAGRKSPLFAEPAVAKLQELSHGIPRRVSQLADLALLVGAGQNLQQIDAGVIEAVCQELGSPAG